MRDQFSDEEWLLLTTTPSLVGAAMAAAGRSGTVGTAKEALKSTTTVARGQKDYPGSRLIASLLGDAAPGQVQEGPRELTGAITERLRARQIDSPTKMRALALEDVDAVRVVLDRLPLEESAAYRSWVLGVAKEVAEASKEGGFLGFGGERVSEDERSFLHTLQGKLG